MEPPSPPWTSPPRTVATLPGPKRWHKEGKEWYQVDAEVQGGPHAGQLDPMYCVTYADLEEYFHPFLEEYYIDRCDRDRYVFPSRMMVHVGR